MIESREPNIERIKAAMERWLDAELAPDARDWLDSAVTRLNDDDSDRAFFLLVSQATRRVGKSDIESAPTRLEEANAARERWTPIGWSADQLTRLYLLLHTPTADKLHERLDKLCATADVGESVTWYRGLPLYPNPEKLEFRAAEGLRTNIKTVFEAVAHHSPFPRESFDVRAWNHMVLKALFIGSSLWPIQGLEERVNPELTRMLRQYAHERWAAKRTISPELWRCVGPLADSEAVQDLRRAIRSDNELERQAAALALMASPDPESVKALKEFPELEAAAQAGALDWETIGKGA